MLLRCLQRITTTGFVDNFPFIISYYRMLQKIIQNVSVFILLFSQFFVTKILNVYLFFGCYYSHHEFYYKQQQN